VQPPQSHGWLDPIRLGRHVGGGESAVRLLQRDDEDRRPRFQNARIPEPVAENRRIGSDDDIRLAALVGDLQVLALRRRATPVTVALIIRLSGMRSQAYCPSPSPRIDSGKMRSSTE
jgi:hypothetical protein